MGNTWGYDDEPVNLDGFGVQQHQNSSNKKWSKQGLFQVVNGH